MGSTKIGVETRGAARAVVAALICAGIWSSGCGGGATTQGTDAAAASGGTTATGGRAGSGGAGATGSGGSATGSGGSATGSGGSATGSGGSATGSGGSATGSGGSATGSGGSATGSGGGSPTGGRGGGAGSGGASTGGRGGASIGTGGGAGGATGTGGKGGAGGATGCSGPGMCASTEFCDFGNNYCGGNGVGVCKPRPGGCTANVAPACACDHQIYSNSCQAAAAGQDASDVGGCTAPTGKFGCGSGFCSKATEYCKVTVGGVLGLTSPGQYQCLPFPATCTSTPTCACLQAVLCTMSADGDVQVTIQAP